jgi:hypothetical protein
MYVYGSESWLLTRSNEESLGVFERKMLLRIFGPVCENVSVFWLIWYNNELYKLFSQPDIVETKKDEYYNNQAMLSQCSPPETRWVQKSWKTNTEMNG